MGESGERDGERGNETESERERRGFNNAKKGRNTQKPTIKEATPTRNDKNNNNY